MSAVIHLVDEVFDNLIFRKVYHVLGGFVITALLVVVDDGRLLYLLGVLYLIAFWVFGKRLSFAVLGGLVLALVTHSRFVCAGAFIVLTFGDGAAAFVGNVIGGDRWPWSPSKTMAGSIAFFVSSLLALVVFFSLATTASARTTMCLAVLISIVGAIVESMPITIIKDRKPDDNLLIILTTGLLFYLVSLAYSESITF